MRNHTHSYIKLIVILFLFQCISTTAIGQQHKLKVACVGNSITYGAGLKNRQRDAYPYVLERILGDQFIVGNFGRSGATLLKNGNLPYCKTPEFGAALKFNANIVIIKLGTNDTKPVNKKYWNQIGADLSSMIDTFLTLSPKPRILLCLPVPAFNTDNKSINDSSLTNVIIPQIKDIAFQKNIEIIDLHTTFTDKALLFPDKIHPNEQGAALIARTVAESILYDVENFSKWEVPLQKSQWNGFNRYDFSIAGRNAIIVEPKKQLIGKPWVVRPAFFGAFAQADLQLLEKGFHVCFYDVTYLYGSERSQKLFDTFYEFMVNEKGFSSKVTLEGFSRGGLFTFNWAMKNPEKVACIYVDAPVCDLKSWPGKKQPVLWAEFLKEYNFTELQADTLKYSPIDNATLLAKAKIPILSVCGESDQTVPYYDNTLLLRNKLTEAGASMRIISKPEVDHHPHSLSNPEPIVDFIIQHQPQYQKKQHIQYRGNLNNSRFLFERAKVGRVAFLGGSITEMHGWHTIIMQQLKQRFPNTMFEFIEAGIGSTGSTPGAFRMKNDVLSKGKIDLLFVEAAVNDDTNGFDSIAQIRGMEGEIRQALLANPYMDIVMQHFIYDPFIPMLNNGEMPKVIKNHERVAEFYQIPSINQAQEIAERMREGEFTWQEFGGTHPSPFGQKFYAASIEALMDKMWSTNTMDNGLEPHIIPVKPLDKYSYFSAKLISPQLAKIKKDWTYYNIWQPTEKAEIRTKFKDISILETIKAGAELSFKFKGTAIGIYCLAGPNAGILEYSIDGKKFQKIDLYTKWSKRIYLPWLFILDDTLKNKIHTLKLRMSEDKNEKSTGNACQIYYFAVNE